MMRIAAVFDVDGTLVRANTVQYYLYFVRHRYRLLKKWAILSSMALRIPYWWALDRINRAWFNRSFYLNFQGLSVDKADLLAQDCFTEYMSKRLILETVEKVRAHQDRGDHVILLSGSLDFFLRPLARYLNIATILAPSLVQEKGTFKGRLTGPPMIGKDKARSLKDYAARHDIDLASSYAYADSPSDLPLLRSIGHPVVVNPGRKLKSIAQRSGWEILSDASFFPPRHSQEILSNSSNPKLENLRGAR